MGEIGQSGFRAVPETAKDAKNSKKGLPEPDPEDDRLAREVIGAAIEVHRILGPGYAETVYEEALSVEFSARAIPFERQQPLKVDYRGHLVGEGRVDFLVGSRLVVEIKAVDQFSPVHVGQVIAYLKSGGLQLGLLINFKVHMLKDGVQRVIRSV